MNSELTIEMSAIKTVELAHDFPSIISQLAEENILKIRDYILDKLASLDGGPSISELKVANLKFSSDMQTGSFRLKFQIDRQFCCSDMQACANDYLDFNFKIADNKVLAHTKYFDWSLTN